MYFDTTPPQHLLNTPPHNSFTQHVCMRLSDKISGQQFLNKTPSLNHFKQQLRVTPSHNTTARSHHTSQRKYTRRFPTTYAVYLSTLDQTTLRTALAVSSLLQVVGFSQKLGNISRCRCQSKVTRRKCVRFFLSRSSNGGRRAAGK